MESKENKGKIFPTLAAFGQEFRKVLDLVAGMPAFAVFLGAWREARQAMA
jgi:hypothetical protein